MVSEYIILVHSLIVLSIYTGTQNYESCIKAFGRIQTRLDILRTQR